MNGPDATSTRTDERRRRSGARGSVLIACMLLASVAWAHATAQERGGGFTSAERDAIRRGELVRRPHVMTRAEPWIGGVSFQVIDRPAEDVWRALHDLAAYRHMLPGTDLTRDDGPDRGARLLYVHQSEVGIEARYWLRLRSTPTERRMQFELDLERPHDVESASGFLELRPYQRTRTLVTWALRARLGMGALEPMVNGLIEPWLLAIPSTMKQFLEGWGRDRYTE